MEQTNWEIPTEVKEILNRSPKVSVLKDRKEIINLALKNKENKIFVVGYKTKDNSFVVEATVTKCKNGLVINYLEKYMRRRNPDCTVIGDNKDTDRIKFKDLFSKDFSEVRLETFEWLKKQELAVLPIKVGGDLTGYYGLLIMQLEGESIPEYFIKVEKQPEVGEKAYDKGSKILNIFFKKEITKFLSKDIDPLGKEIINCCLEDGSIEDYLNLMPMRW